MRVSKKHSAFIQLLISYLVLLILPVSLGIFSYVVSVKTVETDARFINMSILEQSRDVIDSYITEIDNSILAIGLDTKINTLLYSELDEADVMDIIDLRNRINSYTIGDNILDSFFVHFNNFDSILLPHTHYSASDRFYNNYLTYEDMNYEEWREELVKNVYNKYFIPSRNVSIDGVNKKVITYVQTLPLNIPGATKGSIVFLLNEEKIHDLLRHLYIDDGGWFCILDNENRIITSSYPMLDDLSQEVLKYDMPQEMEWKINGERMIVTTVISRTNGWKYIAGLPRNIVLSKVNHIKIVTIATILLILIIGAIIANYMAKRSYRPIQEMLGLLKSDYGTEVSENTKNEYGVLKSGISKLVHSNKAFRDTLEEQAPLLRALVFERLVKGDFNSVKEIKEAFIYHGINNDTNEFAVLLIGLNVDDTNPSEDIEQLDIQRTIVKNIVCDFINESGYTHDINKNTVMLLLFNNKTTDLRQYIETLIASISRKLLHEYDINVSFSIGNIRNKLLDVYRSYNEANQVLNYKLITGRFNVMWYSDIRKSQEKSFYYPPELELKLINLVKDADIEGTKLLLEDLYEENFTKRELSLSMIKRFISLLDGTIIKIEDQLMLDEQGYTSGNYFEDNKPIGQIFEVLSEKFILLCEKSRSKKDELDKKLINAIVGYIENYYSDANLCLASLADVFNMKENYLSHFFKEHVGNTFSGYLENTRIEKAARLLIEEDIPIHKISEMVGYNSDHSFRRAFKRVKGVSPSTLRT